MGIVQISPAKQCAESYSGFTLIPETPPLKLACWPTIIYVRSFCYETLKKQTKPKKRKHLLREIKSIRCVDFQIQLTVRQTHNITISVSLSLSQSATVPLFGIMIMSCVAPTVVVFSSTTCSLCVCDSRKNKPYTSIIPSSPPVSPFSLIYILIHIYFYMKSSAWPNLIW